MRVAAACREVLLGDGDEGLSRWLARWGSVFSDTMVLVDGRPSGVGVVDGGEREFRSGAMSLTAEDYVIKKQPPLGNVGSRLRNSCRACVWRRGRGASSRDQTGRPGSELGETWATGHRTRGGPASRHRSTGRTTYGAMAAEASEAGGEISGRPGYLG